MGQRAGQVATRFQAVDNTRKGLSEGGVSSVVCQSGQGAENRHTGFQQAVHVPAELDQVGELDFRGKEIAQVGAHADLFLGELDIDRGEAALDKA